MQPRSIGFPALGLLAGELVLGGFGWLYYARLADPSVLILLMLRSTYLWFCATGSKRPDPTNPQPLLQRPTLLYAAALVLACCLEWLEPRQLKAAGLMVVWLAGYQLLQVKLQRSHGGWWPAFLKLTGAWLLLHQILFFPWYYWSPLLQTYLPLWPNHHPHGSYGWNLQSAWEYAKHIVLRRPDNDVWRFSSEIMVAILVLFPWRRRRAVTIGLTGLILLALSYKWLEAFSWRHLHLLPSAQLGYLLKHGYEYLVTGAEPMLFGAVGLALFLLLPLTKVVHGCVKQGFSGSAELQAHLGPTKGVVFTLVLISYLVAVPTWFGNERRDPVVHSTIAQLSRWLASPDRHPPMTPNELTHELHRGGRLIRGSHIGPRHILVVIMESYGVHALNHPELPGRQLITRQIEQLQRRMGFHHHFTCSEAPVYGGASWLASASLLHAVPIHHAADYQRLVANPQGRYDLIKHLNKLNYHTISIEPGTYYHDATATSLYSFDSLMTQQKLDYPGPALGFGKMPDQWALGKGLSEAPLNQQAVFVLFKTVSSHVPFLPVSRASHWLHSPTAAPPSPDSWHKPGIYAEDSAYLAAIEYSWQVLAEDLPKLWPQLDQLIVVGDHQPLIASNTSSHPSWKVPVHHFHRGQAGTPPWPTASLAQGCPSRYPDYANLLISALSWIQQNTL